MYGVNPTIADDISFLEELGHQAIEVSGATFVDVLTKKFEPVGCTLIFLLAESHLSFHVSPEHGFVSCDMYTCGDSEPVKAMDLIIKELNPDPNRVYRQIITRGVE